MKDRIKEFKELHNKLLIEAGMEFKKHGFAPAPIQLTYESVLDLTTQEVLNV